MTEIRFFLLLSTLSVFWILAPAAQAQTDDATVETLTHQRHRAVVLTDIEADPDDTQSLVRLLLYANVIDIEGLIATTSVHMKSSVNPESIRKVIRAYGEVQPNLLLHESGFPDADHLLGLVTQGLPEYGMNGVGEGKDMPGSERIIELLEADDDRPLWVSVWGGPNTLAQALYKIRQTKSADEADRLVRKLRVYTIFRSGRQRHLDAPGVPKLVLYREPGRIREGDLDRDQQRDRGDRQHHDQQRLVGRTYPAGTRPARCGVSGRCLGDGGRYAGLSGADSDRIERP